MLLLGEFLNVSLELDVFFGRMTNIFVVFEESL